MTREDRRNLRNGLLFASPYLLGAVFLVVYPFAASLYFSFTKYNVVSAPVWVGLENYRTIFVEDERFWTAIYNTLAYTAFAVPGALALSLTLAMLVHKPIPGRAVFRTIFFLPTIVPIVASSVLWLWIFNPDSGLLNGFLHQIGIVNTPGWIADPDWTKPSFVLMTYWGVGTAMVIFLAGLGDVPQELYESAEIDGAGPLTKFRHVTIPMVTPVILFNLVMGLITSFQYFTEAFIMTAGTGRPADSALFYALFLYQNAFSYLRMGYASALAWMLFVLILSLTAAVMFSSRRWVHYHGG